MSTFRVLQITDPHLRARAGQRLLGVDTADSLRAVLADAVAETPPDLLVASGDLAHDPEPDSYRRFLAVLREFHDGPALFLPGNHDLAEPLVQVLGDADSVRLGPWEVVGFDSHQDHRPEAAFPAAREAALKQRLHRSAARHLLLFCHHPPIDVGCPWLDKDRLQCGSELLEWLAGDGRVRGLVFGHVHQAVTARRAGVALLGTPSTCFQFAPGSEVFTIDRGPNSSQPGYRWLTLADDGSLESELRRLVDYPLNIDLSNRT